MPRKFPLWLAAGWIAVSGPVAALELSAGYGLLSSQQAPLNNSRQTRLEIARENVSGLRYSATLGAGSANDDGFAVDTALLGIAFRQPLPHGFYLLPQIAAGVARSHFRVTDVSSVGALQPGKILSMNSSERDLTDSQWAAELSLRAGVRLGSGDLSMTFTHHRNDTGFRHHPFANAILNTTVTDPGTLILMGAMLDNLRNITLPSVDVGNLDMIALNLGWHF